MKQFIVAVSGHAGVGKDTVADMFVQSFRFTKIALADPLKRICREVFDFDDKQLWGPSQFRNEEDLRYVRQKKGSLGTLDGNPNPKRDIFLTPRYALQTLGTEWGRDCYDNIWVEYGLRVATKLLDGSGTYNAIDGYKDHPPVDYHWEPVRGVVFSDIRFKNEFEMLRTYKGTLIRIHRKSAEEKELEGGVAGHASEAEQDGVDDSFFDVVIHNDGSKDDLFRAVASVYEDMVNGKVP